MLPQAILLLLMLRACLATEEPCTAVQINAPDGIEPIRTSFASNLIMPCGPRAHSITAVKINSQQFESLSCNVRDGWKGKKTIVGRDGRIASQEIWIADTYSALHFECVENCAYDPHFAIGNGKTIHKQSNLMELYCEGMSNAKMFVGGRPMQRAWCIHGSGWRDPGARLISTVGSSQPLQWECRVAPRGGGGGGGASITIGDDFVALKMSNNPCTVDTSNGPGKEVICDRVKKCYQGTALTCEVDADDNTLITGDCFLLKNVCRYRQTAAAPCRLIHPTYGDLPTNCDAVRAFNAKLAGGGGKDCAFNPKKGNFQKYNTNSNPVELSCSKMFGSHYLQMFVGERTMQKASCIPGQGWRDDEGQPISTIDSSQPFEWECRGLSGGGGVDETIGGGGDTIDLTRSNSGNFDNSKGPAKVVAWIVNECYRGTALACTADDSGETISSEDCIMLKNICLYSDPAKPCRVTHLTYGDLPTNCDAVRAFNAKLEGKEKEFEIQTTTPKKEIKKERCKYAGGPVECVDNGHELVIKDTCNSITSAMKCTPMLNNCNNNIILDGWKIPQSVMTDCGAVHAFIARQAGGGGKVPPSTTTATTVTSPRSPVIPARTTKITPDTPKSATTTTTLAPPLTAPEKNSDDSKSAAQTVSTATIAGCSIGGILLLVVITSVVIFFLLKKRQNEDESETKQGETTNNDEEV